MSLLINQAFFLHENPYTETQKNEKNKKIPLKNHSSPQVSWVSYRRKVSVKDLPFTGLKKTSLYYLWVVQSVPCQWKMLHSVNEYKTSYSETAAKPEVFSRHWNKFKSYVFTTSFSLSKSVK